MPRFIKKSKKEVGSAPGTLLLIGEKKTDEPIISIVEYSDQEIVAKDAVPPEALFPYRDSTGTSWINIDGIHDLSLLTSIGEHFGIHPLTLEDIVNTGHRPKVEEFDNYLYIVLKMLQYHDDHHTISAEQLSLVLGENFLISFQETPGDVFAPVRRRIDRSKGRIRQRGCDYLAYALIDAVVDNYFQIIEKIGERIELFEDQLTDSDETVVAKEIHTLKREVIYLRKQVWPMRDVLSRLTKGEFDLIREENYIYWGDVYDHIVQLMDTIESYRDVLSGMLDLHLSTISNRMNEVMKLLTMMASIFIPITFIAGVYGMNFKNMPELEWPWGYGMIWAFMIAVVVVMLVIFKKKKWL